MSQIFIRDEFIKLGQLLKLAGLCDTGADAKEVILEGLVQVNGETALQRGKKVVPGDTVTFDGQTVTVEKRQ